MLSVPHLGLETVFEINLYMLFSISMSPLNVTLNELEDEQENSVEGSSNFKK